MTSTEIEEEAQHIIVCVQLAECVLDYTYLRKLECLPRHLGAGYRVSPSCALLSKAFGWWPVFPFNFWPYIFHIYGGYFVLSHPRVCSACKKLRLRLRFHPVLVILLVQSKNTRLASRCGLGWAFGWCWDSQPPTRLKMP